MKLSFLLFLLLISNVSFSQESDSPYKLIDKEKLPIPNEPNQLFYIQRDPDLNTIVYALNLDQGKLDKSNPVITYWLRYEDRGQQEKLTFIQRKMAYGIHINEIKPEVYELRIQAYKALRIILSKNPKTGKFYALTKVEGEDIILDSIFARILGGSIFKPNVQYFEISGRSIENGKKIKHRFEL